MEQELAPFEVRIYVIISCASYFESALQLLNFFSAEDEGPTHPSAAVAPCFDTCLHSQTDLPVEGLWCGH